MQGKERENWQEFGVRWEIEFKQDRAQLCARALANLDEADWKECVVGLLRNYVNFRKVSNDAEEEERYRAPMLEWYALLTEGFQKGRLAQEKQVQTLQNVKRWVSDTLTPMLAVICATPEGEEWLQHEIVRGISRWKDRHRNLLKQPPTRFHPSSAGGERGQPMLGGLGVSRDAPGDLHHAYYQTGFYLAQYQALHNLSLGFARQDSLLPHSWSDSVRT